MVDVSEITMTVVSCDPITATPEALDLFLAGQETDCLFLAFTFDDPSEGIAFAKAPSARLAMMRALAQKVVAEQATP